MSISAIFEFFAENPPTILIALGGLGWILCALTSINVLCQWWGWFVVGGFILQVLWLTFNKK
jgi:hypothetical protein